MAWQLSELSREEDARRQKCTIEVGTKFLSDNFTLAIYSWAVKRLRVNGANLRWVKSQRDFHSGVFLVEGKESFVAFKLPMGGATLVVDR